MAIVAAKPVEKIDIWSHMPEKILRASDLYGGEIKFEIKFTGLEENQIVSAKEANIHCPQIVIQFYERNLVFGP